MKRQARRSLRARLLTANLLTLTVTLCVFGVLASWVTRNTLRDSLFVRLSAVAAATAAPLTHTSAAGRLARLAPDSERTRANFDEQLAAVVSDTGVRQIRLVNADLQVLADTAGAAPFVTAYDLQVDRSEIARIFSGEQARTSVLFYNEDAQPILRGYAPVLLDGQVIAAVCVDGDAAFLAQLGRINLALALLALLAVSVMGGVTLWQTRRVAAPFEALAQDVQRIGQGDFSTEVPERGDIAESQQLSSTIEAMRRRLQQRDEDQQMMVAGVAHEIRNPLGGMRLFVGLLSEELDDRTAAESHLVRVRRELDHLERVVNDFLSWARRPELTLTTVAVNTLLEEVVDAVRLASSARGVAVDVQCSADVGATLDRGLARGALHNLLQNAVQASAFGDTVRVQVRSSPEWVQIHIQDQGAGMTPKQVQDAFRPFFTTREKGSGLGLPLARRHLELQGGSLELRSTAGTGTIAVVTLPIGAVSAVANNGNEPPDVRNGQPADANQSDAPAAEKESRENPTPVGGENWPDGDTMIG
jgi:signal transduction histidine kinase